MLEKHSKAIAAIALAALAIASFQLVSTPAYSEEDSFGVEKIYPTATGGNEWYVNMDDPRDDPNFRNLGNVQFSKNRDGSWKVSADQIRMEAWSPSGEKWLNVEITEYAKIEGGSNELLQMYSRGGHHTNRDQCLGSAYKARLYGDGLAAWNKEVTHPAYAGNRGSVQATEPLEHKWIGFKAVIYNFVENGKTYVRLESYIDEDVTGSNGRLVVKNNWKLASVYEDRGGWATSNSDFNPSCGRDRDEILTKPGGTSTQNIAAFRSDGLSWSFKYLSVREIQPLSPLPVSNKGEEKPGDQDLTDGNRIGNYYLVAGQHVPNEGKQITIDSIDFYARKRTDTTNNNVIVAIVQENNIIAKATATLEDNASTRFKRITADFNDVMVHGNFDIRILYGEEDTIKVKITRDSSRPGNYFIGEREYAYHDIRLVIDLVESTAITAENTTK